MLSCRDPGTAVIHFRLPGGIRRSMSRPTSAAIGGRRARRNALLPSPLLVRPGASTSVAAAGTAE